MSNTEVFLNHAKVCCVSDIHVGIHQNSNQWHEITLKWASWLAKQLKKKNISDIIISGDFFHYRDEIAVNTIHFATTVLNIWKDFNIIMLVGNHDAYYKDRSDVNSLTVLDGWNNITIISSPTTVTLFNRKTTFCPWGTVPSQIPESDVIFGHFEIQSFRQNSFNICSDGIRTSDLLNKSKLIISGHFHLRDERHYEDGDIVYLGNPFQMDFGDTESVKGYYILDFENLDYEFTENKISPKHKKIYLSKLVEAGTITSETKKDLKGNFVKFIVDKNISPDEVDIVLQKFVAHTPAAINVDYAVNYNKYKLDEGTIHDFSGIDVETAIKEFVHLMDIDNKQEVIDYTIGLYHKAV